MAEAKFDVIAAHRYFSTDCFNRAWDLMEKQGRSQEEDEEMVRLNQSSLWHWTQRPDCTKKNLSVGYWQASRIHVILKRVEAARHYAQLCLHTSEHEAPFYLAYAYETLARTEKLAGNPALAQTYSTEAQRLTDSVVDADERKLLVADLATLA